MLRRAGGDPNITSVLGLTPLSYACALKLSVIPKGGDKLERMQVGQCWLVFRAGLRIGKGWLAENFIGIPSVDDLVSLVLLLAWYTMSYSKAYVECHSAV